MFNLVTESQLLYTIVIMKQGQTVCNLCSQLSTSAKDESSWSSAFCLPTYISLNVPFITSVMYACISNTIFSPDSMKMAFAWLCKALIMVCVRLGPSDFVITR